MLYQDFQGLKLSALGMGGLRFPCGPGGDGCVDERATAEIIEYAITHGVNYFDTAWEYHVGNSEPVLGRLLRDYPRDSFYLATKFPGYDLKNMGRAEEIFEEQLRRCQVDYFDFYLCHHVFEKNIDAYLDGNAQYGDIAYLLKQKQRGRIRHLGFSTHGSIGTVRRFLEGCGQYMEFGQIQLNYLDWFLQNAREKVDLLHAFGLPIWVMEPLRGGKLAALEEKYVSRLAALRPEEGVPAWSFRFLQTIPDVTMVLSGMSSLPQIQENVKIFSESRPLNETEWNTLLAVGEGILEKSFLPCTACRYCVSHCPRGLPIPWLVELYNDLVYSQGGFMAPWGMGALAEDKRPAACIGCRRCEEFCPQGIRISEMMRDFVVRLDQVDK